MYSQRNGSWALLKTSYINTMRNWNRNYIDGASQKKTPWCCDVVGCHPKARFITWAFLKWTEESISTSPAGNLCFCREGGKAICTSRCFPHQPQASNYAAQVHFWARYRKRAFWAQTRSFPASLPSSHPFANNCEGGRIQRTDVACPPSPICSHQKPPRNLAGRALSAQDKMLAWAGRGEGKEGAGWWSWVRPEGPCHCCMGRLHSICRCHVWLKSEWNPPAKAVRTQRTCVKLTASPCVHIFPWAPPRRGGNVSRSPASQKRLVNLGL